MTSAARMRKNRSQLFGRRAAVAAIVALAVLASLLVTAETQAVEASTPISAKAAHSRHGAHAGFEKGLGGWKKTNHRTRLDRVRGGHGHGHYAARIRAPRSGRASIGMTDAPSMIRHTDRGQMYRAHVYLRASRAAVRHTRVVAHIRLAQQHNGKSKVHTWRRVRLSNSRWKSVTVWLTARARNDQVGVTVTAAHVRAGAGILVDSVNVRRVASPRVKHSVLRGTRYGASVDNGSRDWTKALHRADHRYGRLDAVRFFDPYSPSSWSGRLGDTNRPLVYSFSAKPSAILNGNYDRQLTRWFKAAPKRWPIWWTYRHEPEDNIEHGEFAASRYRQAWRHVNHLANKAHNPKLHPTLILMCWTLSPNSGRHFKDYYPGNFIQVLGFDCYNSSSSVTRYKPPSQIFYRAVAKAHALHKRLGVAEFGSRIVPGDDGSRRAMWLADMARYLGRHNAAFATYWDARIPAGNFKLHDLPSRKAWHAVVSAH
ncbi:MAG TPA: hypothetical protein VMT88_12965 [Actinomycetes bacterium]|nr:hypothetical protein [Actinomycetes bacterium]